MPDEKFEKLLSEHKEAEEPITRQKLLDSQSGRHSNLTGDFEWHTPPDLLEAARKTMGAIDLDPASCSKANKNVKAKKYYTQKQDGLKKPWFGRVWLNPPYNRKVIDSFIDKLLNEPIKQAIVLTNNTAETKWAQKLFFRVNAVCFTNYRVRFLKGSFQQSNSPLFGQAIWGINVNEKKFKKNFEKFGSVLKPL